MFGWDIMPRIVSAGIFRPVRLESVSYTHLLLADVTQQLFNMHIAIHSLNSRETKDGGAVITATITIHGLEHLQSIIARLSGIEGVYSVRRS